MTIETDSFEEPIRILSDLHLGSVSTHIREVEDLRPLLEGARTVIFNGDTYEERIPELVERSKLQFEELKALCEEMEIRAVFLTGNHDPEVSDLHYLDLCGGRFFVTHGDLLFHEITPWSLEIDDIREDIAELQRSFGHRADHDLGVAIQQLRATRTAIRAHPLRLRRKNIFAKLLWALREFWPPRRILGILSVWSTTPHMAREALRRYRPEAECLIMGHTHRRQVSNLPPRHYLNTGAFAPGLGKYVVEVLHEQLWLYEPRMRDGSWQLAGRRHFGD